MKYANKKVMKRVGAGIVAGAAMLTAMTGVAKAEGGAVSKIETAFSESKPIFNYRLRYEAVSQDGFARDADALTSRLRAGFKTGKAWDTSFLVEFDWIEDIADEFNSTTNGRTQFPVVADPNATELNRFQLTNTSLPDTKVTLGRQGINLDDQRFVGTVAWRQNDQTFDAIRVENTSIDGLKVDVSYINRVNRIFGDDSPIGDFEGDIVLANVTYKTALGALTGFAYLLDLENGAAVSSKTFGLRYAGSHEIGKTKASLNASYAAQSDYADNPSDFSEDYYFVQGAFAVKGATIGAGYEVLSGNGASAFQTSLATLHKFQGFADAFLATPDSGLEDVYLTAGYGTKAVGPFKALKLTATLHDFEAETGSVDLGDEFDIAAVAVLEKVKFLVKYADFNAGDVGVSREKLWLQMDISL